MGLLINGVWDAEATMIPIESGRFVREPAAFRDIVTADGASGFRTRTAAAMPRFNALARTLYDNWRRVAFKA